MIKRRQPHWKPIVWLHLGRQVRKWKSPSTNLLTEILPKLLFHVEKLWRPHNHVLIKNGQRCIISLKFYNVRLLHVFYYHLLYCAAVYFCLVCWLSRDDKETRVIIKQCEPLKQMPTDTWFIALAVAWWQFFGNCWLHFIFTRLQNSQQHFVDLHLKYFFIESDTVKVLYSSPYCSHLKVLTGVTS